MPETIDDHGDGLWRHFEGAFQIGYLKALVDCVTGAFEHLHTVPFVRAKI